MAVQVNLLPDIKQERIRAARLKRTIISVTTIILVVAVAVPVVLFVLNQGIKLATNRTQAEINERKNTIENFENINTMLTVQSNLDNLPELYQRRAFSTDLLQTITPLLPSEISLSSLEADMSGNIQFIGIAPNFSSVQKFYNALLYAGLDANPDSVDPDPQVNGQFTNLTLENASGDSEEISFSINATFSTELITGEDNGDQVQEAGQE